MTRPVRRYVVAGRVQGVGYRWFVREAARALGVSGWVRNDRDGTVVLVVAGTPEQHAALDARLREGPAGSMVQQVAIADVTDEGIALDAGGAVIASATTHPFAVVRV